MGPKHGKLAFAKTKDHEVNPLPLERYVLRLANNFTARRNYPATRAQ